MSVILYSTGCANCRVLEAKMGAKGIKYELVSDVEVMREKGFMAAPMLDVDGDVMNFVKANEWVNKQ